MQPPPRWARSGSPAASLYWRGYAQAANKRSRGFGVQAIACFVLWLGALGGIA